MKTAIVIGLSGQDGSLLAEQLLEQDWKVYGMIRRSSRGLDLGCASDLENHPNLEVVEGDLLDLPSLQQLCNLARADHFYQTAAMSHVGTSFSQPVFTIHNNTIGTLNCLEAVRNSGIHTRFLHCATSEMYGGISSEPANEGTIFYPKSPYGVSKLAAFWIVKNYRETWKMFACNSICFNHEEPGKRGPNFVTRKISLGVANIKAGKQDYLYLGNLDARRDWGVAHDFTRGMKMMLDAAEPDDYVLATGKTHSVREFCQIAFEHARLGDYQQYVKIDPKFYRPCEVDVLIGDYSKAKRELGWEPTTKFEQLVKDMVDYDCDALSL